MILRSLLPFFEWLQHTHLGETIRNSATLIALLESVHLTGMTLLVGAILIVDLSLLDLGIGGQPVARMAREMNKWTIAGLATMLASGPLILSSEAVRCFQSPMFWVKMTLLAIAVAFHFTIHRRVVLREPFPGSNARIVGIVSLALWTAVAIAAKGIPLFEQ